MQKTIAGLLLLFSFLFIFSCGQGEQGMDDNDNNQNQGPKFFSNDNEKAEERLRQVVNAINEKNKDDLEGLFSMVAIDEAESFDERMDYLFEFVQGSIESWDRIGGTVDSSYDHGNTRTKSRYWYDAKTEKELYLIFLLEYTEDTEHPENVGLYMLQVIKLKDRMTQFDGGQEILCAGIYKPNTNSP